MNQQSILQIDDLHYAFRTEAGLKPVIQAVSLHVQAGETLALVGESGSGKSVTAQAILRLHDNRTAVQTQGQISFAGKPITASSVFSLRQREVGMIFQEPMVSLNPLQNVLQQIGERWQISRPEAANETETRVLEWLHKVGLRNPEEKLNAYPHQLSGGERQRAMIAMALITEPKLLIADEPTTALDVTIQGQILDLLRSLKDELGMAMLFITHDLNIVRQLADRVAVMRYGEVIETGHTASLFATPQHHYTRMLIEAEPEPIKSTAISDKAILSAQQLKVWFPIKRGVLRRTVGHVKAVNGIDFAVPQGQTLGIIGESGSGKSTTALSLLGLLDDAEGEVDFDDTNLLTLRHKQLLPYRARIQMIFQDPFSALSPRLSVADIIAEGLEVHQKLNRAERDARVVAVMQQVSLDPATRHRYPTEFSGGQRQRIAVARALVLEPELLILDEPTSSLDRSVQKQILELLRDLQQRLGLSYLLITHDLAVVRALCHRVAVMQAGEIIEQGSTQAVFESPQYDYTKTLLSAELLTQ